MGEQTAGDPARAARAAAIGEFAAALRELRRTAGDPSFREMAGRSRAISHTTLHEAAQGNRLPSWATTVEFVRACGAWVDGDWMSQYGSRNLANQGVSWTAILQRYYDGIVLAS